MGQLSVVGSIILYISTFGLSGLISKIKLNNKFLKLILVITPPILLATFRYNVGYDYGSYISAFEYFSVQPLESIFLDNKVGDPIAYYLVTKIATTFGSEQIFLMILALCALVPAAIYVLREWNDKQTQPLILFCLLFNTFIFSFSACKQGIAMCIAMFSLKFVYERKLIKFSLCMAIAFLFHSTAIVFIFVYFFLNNKGNMSTIKKIVIIFLCIMVIVNLQPILENFLHGKYEGYATNIVEGKNRSFWLYTLITVLFLFFREKFVEIDKRNDLLIMMMVVGTILLYLGFSNAFTKRIAEYFLLAKVFLIPQCIYLFTKKSRVIVKLLIVAYIVAIFYIATPQASSGMGLIPYQYKFW